MIYPSFLTNGSTIGICAPSAGAGKDLESFDACLDTLKQQGYNIKETQTLEFSQTQNKFLNYLKSDAKILDFGCGAGRDAKYFLEHGYDVDASDGSIEMVKAASKLTGLDVKLLLFEDLNEKDMYDGIWACSSICSGVLIKSRVGTSLPLFSQYITCLSSSVRG